MCRGVVWCLCGVVLFGVWLCCLECLLLGVGCCCTGRFCCLEGEYVVVCGGLVWLYYSECNVFVWCGAVVLFRVSCVVVLFGLEVV